MSPKKIDRVQVKILQGNGVNFPLQKTAWNHGTKNMNTTRTASLPAQWELRAPRNLAAITLRYALPSFWKSTIGLFTGDYGRTLK